MQSQRGKEFKIETKLVYWIFWVLKLQVHLIIASPLHFGILTLEVNPQLTSFVFAVTLNWEAGIMYMYYFSTRTINMYCKDILIKIKINWETAIFLSLLHNTFLRALSFAISKSRVTLKLYAQTREPDHPVWVSDQHLILGQVIQMTQTNHLHMVTAIIAASSCVYCKHWISSGI